MIKGFLIDPVAKEISPVEISGSLDSIYELLNIQLFTVATTFSNGDDIYVDDEGLLKEDQRFFAVRNNYPAQPFYAGRGLVVGHDEYGDMVDASSNLEFLRHMIVFQR